MLSPTAPPPATHIPAHSATTIRHAIGGAKQGTAVVNGKPGMGRQGNDADYGCT